MKALLAIPCYNCEKQIIRVIKDLKSNSIGESYDIVFINNKSSDDTKNAIVENYKSNGILLDNKKNYGLGGTFKIVHQFALENKYESFLFFHGDDQASVSDISKLVFEYHNNESLVAVLGARFMPQSKRFNYSFIRTMGNQFFNIIFSIITFRRIYEIGSGLNLYKTEALCDLDIQHWPNHIAFDVNILLGLIERNLKFSFVPISWREKDQVSNAQNLSTGLLILGMLLKWCLRINNKGQKWQTNFEYDKISL